MEQEAVLCMICQKPIPARAERYRRGEGNLHLGCDERRAGIDIVVKRVLGHQWTEQGGCTLFVEGEVGQTVRMTWRVTLPTAADVAAVKAIIAPIPGGQPG